MNCINFIDRYDSATLQIQLIDKFFFNDIDTALEVKIKASYNSFLANVDTSIREEDVAGLRKLFALTYNSKLQDFKFKNAEQDIRVDAHVNASGDLATKFFLSNGPHAAIIFQVIIDLHDVPEIVKGMDVVLSDFELKK